ncbi:hypothetical protein HPT25_05735 [Bacillus sp. BRMEA1]|uniref:hypothetical protein n=1 Tax=Neobacillus endophyticus TaxID=2738405 RepID=UPI001566B954|nr:hypothetical protein [Neobacillus endophyticus]NRD76995.1 hypothetical protein [Neobacillus endophyticus]
MNTLISVRSPLEYGQAVGENTVKLSKSESDSDRRSVEPHESSPYPGELRTG